MTLRHKIVYVSLVFLIFCAIPAFSQDNTAEYEKTIESADSYFSKGDYINAKASYQIAVRLAPEEQYPKDRLQQSLDMIKVQMYQNNLYQQKIQVADDMFTKGDFTGALQYYQEALSILPGDVYASGKIQEINRTQVDAQQVDADYQKSITAADQFIKEGKLDKALAEYKNASSLKPSESYPRQKAIETEALIAQKKNITDEYLVSLQSADLAISRNKYDEAIKLLEKAINLMPGEPLPKQKLAEAQSLKAAWDSYNSIITAADDYYVNREFLLAKDKYLQAQAIKPEDEYPKRMLEKIDIALMDVEQANRSSYAFTIQRADELFSQQDYEKAMVEYQKALLFKPDETYAKQRINDINNALNLRNSQEEAYTQAISRADGMFKEEKYADAKAEYNRAIGIKPLEQYPKVKIEEINTILKDLSTKQELYTNLIKGADRLFFSDEYEEAREQYRQASYLFQKEKYPIDQITMINEILGQRDTYVKAVTRADQLFYEQDFEAALMEFRTASALQPDEKYPKEKILEIEALLADAEIDIEDKQQALENYNKEQVYEVEEDAAGVAAMQAIEKQYWDMIASADAAMAAKDYQKALTDYEAARKLKPGEIYAQGKITEIKPILEDIAAKEIAAKAAAEAALEKQYQEAIAAGDLALKGNDYQTALSSYQVASSLKPQATYASGKIAEINTTLAEIAAKKAAEEAEIAAKKAAEEAEIAAKEEAAEAEAAATAAAEAALEKQYQEAIAAGDLALKGNDYQKALSSYQVASGLKPQATYASGKIAEINITLAEIAAKKAAEEAELAAKKAAEEAELAAKEEAAKAEAAATAAAEAALEKQFQEAIAAGDLALKGNDYQTALSSYQTAASLKPQATYASGKIAEINTTLAELAAKKAAEEAEIAAKKAAEESELAAKEEAAKAEAAATAAAEAALEKQYQDAIAAGDLALKGNDYQTALSSYQTAASLKPQATYASGKIAEINTTLAEIAAKKAAEEAELAAKEEAAKAEAAAKAAAEAALEKQYQDAIAAGDLALKGNDYQKALSSYQVASGLKPQATYASGKIAEINTMLAEIAAKKAAEEAELAAKKAAEEAELAAKEEAAKAEAAATAAAEAALEKKYQDAIAAGDLALKGNDYQTALSSYQTAASLKPQATYASGKIAEINTTLAEIAAKKAAEEAELAAKKAAEEAELAAKEEAAKAEAAATAAAEAALEKQFQEAIAAGDLALKGNDYQTALSSYQVASGLKPQATYASGKIAEINTTLAEIATKKAAEEAEIAAKEEAAKAEAAAKAAAEAALEKQYQQAIAAGDLALKGNDYQKALSSYQTAASLKPQATYASEKILEVNTTLAQQAKQLELEQQYVKIIATADEYLETNNYEEARAAYKAAGELKPEETYPGKQILQIDHTLESMAAEREQAYQNAVTKADLFFAQKDYEMAKLQYSRVLELKPDDAVAQQKLKLIDEQIMIKRQLIQQEYDKTIIDADKFYTAKTYDNAIDSYRAASLLKPEEQYPKEMVSRILKVLTERSIVQINREALLIPNNTTHKFEFNPVPAKDRKSNYIFFRARNVSDKEYKLIISFGEGQSKNGGVVVKVPAGESMYEFVVRISAQYKWFSDDNNWISFYPEGGDIEVSLMQISYSD